MGAATETGTRARPLVLLDPTIEPEPAVLRPAPRVEGLAGLTVGLVDNGKANAARFLELLAERLQAGYGAGATVWHHKPNASRPASDEALDDLAGRAGAAIAAVGD
jgi:hypothetical protein